MIDIESQGGGGQYIPEDYFTEQAFNGAASPNQEIVVLNAPVNGVARLESLVGSDEQDSYDIEVDGELVISSQKLSDLTGNASGTFYVSQAGFIPSINYSRRIIQDIIGSQIIIRFKGGSGVANIQYHYSFGKV